MEMINSLQQKSNNIVTAWKFLLLLFYPFTSNVNSLIALITIEKKNGIYTVTVTNNKLVKIYRRYNMYIIFYQWKRLC